jgi:hypothetical protein
MDFLPIGRVKLLCISIKEIVWCFVWVMTKDYKFYVLIADLSYFFLIFLIYIYKHIKIRYFSPIFETKGWKGKPIIRLDNFEDHVAVPFEFSDSDKNLYMNFGFDDNRWIKMEKFYVEKRGDYNITDDDY